MARSFASASSQYLEIASAAVSADPLTLACWANPGSTSAQAIMFIGDKDSAGDWFSLGTDGSSKFQAWHRKDSFTAGRFEGTTTYSTGTWYHIAAQFESSISRRIFVNGSQEGFNNASVVTDWTNDRTSIGRFGDSTPSSNFDGYVAHAAIWNVALSANEIADLYNNGIGVDPRNVRPDALVAYWPLLDSDGDADWWGQSNLTASGSPTYVAHPPTLMKSRPRFVVIGGGGGGSGFQPAWARFSNSIIGAGVAG